MQRNKKILIALAVYFILWILTLIVFPLSRARAEGPMLSPEQVYDAQMEQWLDRLQSDESGKNPLLVILDTNNKYSYGCLQFQAGTWAPYSRKYDVDKEIMDCSAQRYVAKKMIKDDYNAWRNWFTSVTKKTAGKPPVLVIQ
jgi:hypothetical protein